jgi:hypothetical protein
MEVANKSLLATAYSRARTATLAGTEKPRKEPVDGVLPM